MKIILCLLTLGLLIGSSCRNKNPNMSKEDLQTALSNDSTTSAVAASPDIPEGYIPPAGIKFSPKRDLSTPPVRIDVVAGLKQERKAKLSDFGKEVVYYRTGEIDEYAHMKQIYPVPDGYLLNSTEGLWLLNKDFKADRQLVKNDVSFKSEGTFTFMTSQAALSSFYYDPATRSVSYIYMQKPEVKRDDYIQFIGTAPLDEWLKAIAPVNAADLKKTLKSSRNNFIYPHKKGFGMLGHYSKGLYTFDQKGDTLCYFVSGKQGEEDPNGTIRGAEDSNCYMFEGSLRHRQAYVDTVFRVVDGTTFQPVYKIDLGKYQVSRADGMKPSFDLSEMYLVNELTESTDKVYLSVTQNYYCPNTRDAKTVKFFYLIYDKKTGGLYSFTDRSNQSQPTGIPNDLDGGLPFWPSLQIDGIPYMFFSGKGLRLQYPEEVLNKIPGLKDVKDNEIVFITVK